MTPTPPQRRPAGQHRGRRHRRPATARRRHRLHAVAARARALPVRSPSGSSTGRSRRPIACSSPQRDARRRRGARVTYAEALRRVRRLAQALLDRQLSRRAPDGDPVGQQHRARAAGAGRDVRRRALRADRAGLLAAGERVRHAAPDLRRMQPGLGVRGRGRAVRARAQAALPAGVELVVSSSAPAGLPSTSFASSRRRPRRPRWTPRARVSGRTRSPRCCSRRGPPAGRRASSTRSGCCARTRR